MRTLNSEQTAALAAMPDRWITPEEAARLLSVGLRSIWRLAEAGKIPPPVRFTRKLVRFDRTALIEHLRRLSQRPSAPEKPGPVEPHTPCPKCGRPLWWMRRRNTDEPEFYCPNCIRMELGEAS